MAQRDNEMDWLEQQMAIVERRRRMFAHYHERVQERPEGKRAKLPRMLDVKETVSAISNVTRTEDGEMMWRGGIHRLEAEKKRWLELCRGRGSLQ